jgi:galactonate dehydratase
MKITRLETFLTNAGLRDYLFVRLTTDSGLTGLGEASLEWQERTVETLIHEWVEDRVLGVDPFDVERVIGGLIRDQYQGGSTVLTAISSVEIAFWDLIGKACGQPVYRLLGGRARERLPSYANGWYGGARTPEDFAVLAQAVVGRGYRGLKFDPFGTAWKEMTSAEMAAAEAIVAAVRGAVGESVDLMIEVHGRLSAGCAVEMGRRLAPYRPAWYEEPVAPGSLDLLSEVKRALPFPIATGERLYTLEEFQQLLGPRNCDVVQPDLAHCGGLWIGKKIAALAQARDVRVAPHCSVGPVALCAAIHFGWATPTVLVQENFSEYDVPWRKELVGGWDPVRGGEFALPEGPGLGIELNVEACTRHPYKKNSLTLF